jgi:hypothetical protein
MANAQLLMYSSTIVWVEAFGTELLFFLFFFLKKCEYPMVLSDLEIPPDLKTGYSSCTRNTVDVNTSSASQLHVRIPSNLALRRC